MNKTDIANKTETARTNLSKKENRIYCAFITKNYDTLRSYFVFIGRKYCLFNLLCFSIQAQYQFSFWIFCFSIRVQRYQLLYQQ